MANFLINVFKNLVQSNCDLSLEIWKAWFIYGKDVVRNDWRWLLRVGVLLGPKTKTSDIISDSSDVLIYEMTF